MSEFSRETLINIIETDHVQCGEASALARMVLAAMDSEPVAYTEKHEISNMHATGLYLRAWPADRARNAVEGYTIPLYTTPQPISLVNSEPVAYIFKHPAGRLFWALTDESNKGQNDVMPVYASPQPAPVVPEEWTIADAVKFCKETGRQDAGAATDAWNACRAAMLQELKKSAGAEATCRSDENVQVLHTKSPAQSDCCPAQNHVSPEQNGDTPAQSQGWIQVSEQMPEVGDIVLTAMGGVVNVGETECSAANCRFFTSVISGRELPATHWMPLPAAPQEVKSES
ncbi:DUF551 domain-containing protein [Klebsiella pneumoniae]